MSSEPSWPDANVISQIANSLFQMLPNQPLAAPASPGIPIAPPSPTLVPGPSTVTSIAPHAPAASPYGLPDVPTTIPSYVPTPNLSTPVAPSLAQSGFASFPLADIPQPGASPGSFHPTGPGVVTDADVGPLTTAALAPATLTSGPTVPSVNVPQPGAVNEINFGPVTSLAPRQAAPAPVPPAGLPTDAPQPGATAGSYDPGLRSDIDLGPLVALALAPSAQVPGASIPSADVPQPGGSAGSYDPGVPTPDELADLPSRLGELLSLTSPRPFPASPAPEIPSAGVPAVPATGAGFLPGTAPADISAPSDRLYFLSESQAFARAAEPVAAPPADAAPVAPPVPGVDAPVSVPATPSVAPQPLPASEIGLGVRPFDPYSIRREFPILQERVNGRPLIWLDNAATTQKPKYVIDRLTYFYEHENSNIHRAAHELAARATDAYEKARDSVRRFLNAPSSADIVFVRGTTEAINLVAQSWGRKNIGPGDEIVITWLEHHANIVPWQLLCTEKGAHLKVVPVDDSGQVLLDAYEKLIGPRTKLVSFTQVSNALGTVTPAKKMIEIAHRHGVPVLLDGAQSVSHMRVDVQALDADWFVFSGHKVFGPTGIGALYGKSGLLEAMPPWQGGGNMIEDVTFERTRFHPAPARFEAGTGNIADAVGLGAALDYISGIGMENVARHEHELLLYGTRLLGTVPGLRLIGTAAEKAGVLSFVIDGVPTEEIGQELNRDGIAVRSGHHCAQPILRRFGLEATVRPSLAVYNTHEDIEALCASLHRIATTRRGIRR